MKSEWKPVTYELNENRLKLHVYPYIGNKDITNIERLDILKIIQKLQEKEHFEIAERILKVIEKIYKYAVTYGFVEHNIIADIDDDFELVISLRDLVPEEELSKREYKCGNCGLEIDRDLNASINLKQTKEYTVLV